MTRNSDDAASAGRFRATFVLLGLVLVTSAVAGCEAFKQLDSVNLTDEQENDDRRAEARDAEQMPKTEKANLDQELADAKAKTKKLYPPQKESGSGGGGGGGGGGSH